ncbi:alkaline phosphatase D family protein [Nitrogeniibacter aestuarii]|uniref:alkaline phosphatase D family protein n=1 Tax=Nitrogeniibacter aestuarii TaxID=2815343 RepID=UPI001E4D2922|nr:alkaline phosphatase D family protein [Nitrogeniibacter aestuarii]
MSVVLKPSRRRFLKSTGLLLGAAVPGVAGVRTAFAAPAYITLDGNRPQLDQGIQIGDVRADRAMIWSRTDRPSRMIVEYDFDGSFAEPVMLRGPHALQTTDYTSRLDLTGLPADREVFVRVSYQDLSNERVMSEAVSGRFVTAPIGARDIRFVWSGDTAGQGWGINPDFGGMKIYEAMRQTQPDFFIHSGDNIYADGPISEYQDAEDGKVWRNLVTEEVSKVAESLDEFRGRYKYNLMDENVRRFNAEVPQIWQWDDHEVVNNWSDSKDLSGDIRYSEKNVPLLVARGSRAFQEYAPMRPFSAVESERVYRHIPYGRLMDVFVLDMRSYRGPNTDNRQTEASPETAFLGAEQVAWLKRKLAESRAVWKVIAADMPIGLLVRDGAKWENLANGDGEPLGRELEMADLLRYIKRAHIKNTVWFTADVHYCAAHYYDPNKAQFQDFDPFWEFVTGPLNAGSFGPNGLDNTFGPQVVFQKAPPAANTSPFGGYQFFGQVDIDARTAEMTVALKDIDGATVFTKTLAPEGRGRGYGHGHGDKHDHEHDHGRGRDRDRR